MNILIAEDDQNIAQAYTSILRRRGHRLTLTRNGLQCLNKYRMDLKYEELKPISKFDLVIVDHAMPIKDGATLANEILEINPNQRIVYVSAFGKDLLGKIDAESGVEFMPKPFTLKALLNLVEKKPIQSLQS